MNSKIIFTLLIILSLLCIAVSLTGILKPDIYSNKINTITDSELLGQDTITLIISIVLVFLIFIEKKNKFLVIINTGFLIYFLYVYLYFSFGLITSKLYILYLLIIGLSLFLFIFRINLIIKNKNGFEILKKYPAKSVSIFFTAIVLMMYIIEVPYLVKISIIENLPIQPYKLYLVLDMAILFPGILIVAYMNFKKYFSGIILSGVILIKIITLMPAIICNDIFHWIKTGFFIDITFDIIALIITLCSLAVLIIYKSGIKYSL
jgi:hypothetical protein